MSDHLDHYRQMAFLTGPRQVGTTTTCRELADVYFNWNNDDHRELILRGPAAVASEAGLELAASQPTVAVFDELHRYKRWKLFLKGFFDTYERSTRILVTGSSRLDVFRRGGDSLMGRYFLIRMHPFSAGELVRTEPPAAVLQPPHHTPDPDWEALWEHGGYPEPFIRREPRFSRRWR